MVSMQVLARRIGTTLFRTRIGTLGVVSLVSMLEKMLSCIVKACMERLYIYGQLVCPAKANTLHGFVQLRVAFSETRRQHKKERYGQEI